MTTENITDPDRARKIAGEEFFHQARYHRAAGTQSAQAAQNQEFVDSLGPGWYDVWENAEPMSDEAFYRRNAIVEGLIPGTIVCFNHPGDSDMTLKNTATKESVEVTLTGTDEEMRDTVRAALKVLLPERAGAFVTSAFRPDGFELVGVSDGFDSPAFIRITDPNGVVTLLPTEYLSPLIQCGLGVAQEIRSHQVVTRRAFAGDPAQYGLTTEGIGTQFFLSGQDPKVKGTAYIRWVGAPDFDVNAWGWLLWSEEFATSWLDFARWDDLGGIHRMADLLRDRESLLELATVESEDYQAWLADRLALAAEGE